MISIEIVPAKSSSLVMHADVVRRSGTSVDGTLPVVF